MSTLQRERGVHILAFQGFLARIVDLSFFATKMNTKSKAGPVTLKTLTYYFFSNMMASQEMMCQHSPSTSTGNT